MLYGVGDSDFRAAGVARRSFTSEASVRSISRRAVLASSFAFALNGTGHDAPARVPPAITFDLAQSNPDHRFDPGWFDIVGVYDFDWLLAPEFTRMLDLIASSPGAIGGVRAFGIFTMGEREDLKPGTGGVVWDDPAAEPDFTLPFEALNQLTSRGLTPFASLGFFPPAVSSSPIQPPSTFDAWAHLVRSFLQGLIADERFGREAIKQWAFEVWNEPNEGRFWSGSFEQYLELYRATSEAVTELGIDIRLGGPAMAYKPESEAEDGPETMTRFLEFLRDDPSIRCDFISYHRKGTVDSSKPDPQRLYDAAIEISRLVDSIVPERAEHLALINNEADEKIGFETSYPPRMDAFAASWLTTLACTHVALSAGGRRCGAVQDNANLQLMQTPFDGRRSIFSFLDAEDRENLVKTSGAVWYDLLPMLDGAIVPAEPASALFPSSSLHAMVSSSETGVSVLATYHPIDTSSEASLSVSISLEGIPWHAINVAQWRIDATRANAYSTALQLDAGMMNGYSDADAVVIRDAQELQWVDSVHSLNEGEKAPLGIEIKLAAYDTVLYRITPITADPIASPSNPRLRPYRRGIEITWDPVEHKRLLGYEIARGGKVIAGPIRPCLWIDSISVEDATYTVRAVTASGIASDWAVAQVT